MVAWKRLLPIGLLLLGLVVVSWPQVLVPTPYINPQTSRVQDAIAQVQAASVTDYDRIVNTAAYIHQTVAYAPLGDACFAQTPEDVLTLGEGNCVSTTKLATAMLTGMDIPVLIIEGCAFPLSRDWLIPADATAKREGAVTKNARGQLHSWIRAHDGHNWYTVETTAGVVFPATNEDSYGYSTFGGYVDPADGTHLCVLQNPRYVDFCTEDS